MQCQRLYRLHFRYESIFIMNNDLVARLIFFLAAYTEKKRHLTLMIFSFQSIALFSTNGSMELIEPKETSWLVLLAVSSPTKKILPASQIPFYRFFIARHFHRGLHDWWRNWISLSPNVCAFMNLKRKHQIQIAPNATSTIYGEKERERETKE